MKRLFSAILVISLALTLAACSNQPADENNDDIQAQLDELKNEISSLQEENDSLKNESESASDDDSIDDDNHQNSSDGEMTGLSREEIDNMSWLEKEQYLIDIGLISERDVYEEYTFDERTYMNIVENWKTHIYEAYNNFCRENGLPESGVFGRVSWAEMFQGRYDYWYLTTKASGTFNPNSPYDEISIYIFPKLDRPKTYYIMTFCYNYIKGEEQQDGSYDEQFSFFPVQLSTYRAYDENGEFLDFYVIEDFNIMYYDEYDEIYESFAIISGLANIVYEDDDELFAFYDYLRELKFHFDVTDQFQDYFGGSLTGNDIQQFR